MVRKIYLTRIYYTSMTDYKDRPVLIVKEYEKFDVLFAPLTTNLQRGGIEITTADLEHGSLLRPSVVIAAKLATISQTLLLKELATLKQETFAKVMRQICQGFACTDFLGNQG